MTFPSETLGVPTTGLPVLLELVHERTGLFFGNGRGDLFAERMAPLVVERGFRSFLDLYYLLKYDESGGNDGWRQVLDALSVPETYFWREIDQIHAVAKCIMPELARKARGPIRIWSAPCASGEEPLTIAMVLEEQAAITQRLGPSNPKRCAITSLGVSGRWLRTSEGRA